MYTTLGMLKATTGGVAPPPAFPTLVSHNHRVAASGSSAARTIPYPASIVANQLLVLAVTLESGSFTISVPTGYTRVASGDNVFYKVAIGGETGNLTFHLNTSGTASNASLFVFNNATMAAAADFASSSNANPPSLTVSWGATNNLFLALYHAMGVATSFGGGYPSNCPLYHSADTSLAFDEAIAGAESALATFDPTTFSTSGGNVAFTIGLKP